jgi:hypothetical protein
VAGDVVAGSIACSHGASRTSGATTSRWLGDR